MKYPAQTGGMATHSARIAGAKCWARAGRNGPLVPGPGQEALAAGHGDGCGRFGRTPVAVVNHGLGQLVRRRRSLGASAWGGLNHVVRAAARRKRAACHSKVIDGWRAVSGSTAALRAITA